MTKKKNFWDNPNIKNRKELLYIFFEFLIILLSIYILSFTGRIYPNTYVAGVNLGGKNREQATQLLINTIKVPDSLKLTFSDQVYNITPESIDLVLNHKSSVENAYNIHRTGNILYDFCQRFVSLYKRNDLGLHFSKDEEKLDDIISLISDQTETQPIFPSLEIKGGNVSVKRGSVGYKLDKNLLKAKIGYGFSFLDITDIEIPIVMLDPKLSDLEESNYLKRGQNILNKKLDLVYAEEAFTFQKENLLNLINPYGDYYKQQISKNIADISQKLNHEPINSIFVFTEGRVKEFTPSKDGVRVKEDLLYTMIIGNLRTLEETSAEAASVIIPVELTPPKVKTSDVNNLGIQELIGQGVSYFAGSIPGRIHNINLASSKFTGILVAPGETFSFIKTIGDISTETGYKQAYIISGGKTILGDGGGVCQVSTTLFRAVLNAGLPITERTAHAYRVGYYEQSSPPGLDATVFSPSVDFKFKNDTAKHILIQTRIDNKKAMLTFEIYGTKDGRVVTVTKPKVFNQIAPPPDVYQDDPTKPAGTILQTEHKAWGATVTFTYSVEKDGKTIYKRNFSSKYQPWAAVYLRGTAPLQ